MDRAARYLLPWHFLSPRVVKVSIAAVAVFQLFRRPADDAAHGELSKSSVMHSAQLCAGFRCRQSADPVNAGVTGVKGDGTVHIRFYFRRGETEVKQPCHVMAAVVMTMTHHPERSRPL